VVHCSQSHDWKFLDSHLPCLVMFDCANSDYGYCEEDCEGLFDRRHRQPWIRPPGRHRIAGHVAVIAGTDEHNIFMVANRPDNYSEDLYQGISKADFDQRWFGYCLCLRRRHRLPNPVAPVAPNPPPPVPAPVPAPPPALPNGPLTIIIENQQQQIVTLQKQIDDLQKWRKSFKGTIRVTITPK
jgi:hypothetical protein